MWQRQLELRLFLPIAQVLRHTHPRMAEMEVPQVADWAAANRPRALRAMALVDEALSARPFIAGERFTVADITGLVALDFAKPARIAIPPELVHLNRWHAALGRAQRRGVKRRSWKTGASTSLSGRRARHCATSNGGRRGERMDEQGGHMDEHMRRR